MANRNPHGAGLSCKCLVKEESIEEFLTKLNPHTFCQECYYGYPYALQRALETRLEGSVHDPTYKMDQLKMKYSDLLPSSSSQAGHNAPPSSETEIKWKEALIYKKMPLLSLDEDRESRVPSLQYLSKVSLWESLRRFENYQEIVKKLPIQGCLQNDLIKFVENEELSLQRHLSSKFSQLLFCQEFLESL